MTPGEFRLRVVYRKTGRLRHLSHLEVIHSLERMVRRAQLPYAVTQGFSPHMKVAFGPALPVGTAGEREYLDVWLTRYAKAESLLDAMVEASTEELAPYGAQYVSAGEGSLSALLTIGLYEVEIDGEEIQQGLVQEALDATMVSGVLEFEQKGKLKVFDVARCVPKDPRATRRDGGVEIDLTVRMGPHGSLRPEVLVRAALRSAMIDVSAVRTTRRETLIETEDGVWSRPV